MWVLFLSFCLFFFVFLFLAKRNEPFQAVFRMNERNDFTNGDSFWFFFFLFFAT